MKTIEQIGAEIAAALPLSLAPPDLVARMLTFHTDNKELINLNRQAALSIAEDFLAVAIAEDPNDECGWRVSAAILMQAAAIVISDLKRRQGAALDPARFAVVAFEQAEFIRDCVDQSGASQ
jgi:hypothetical protein